MRHVKQKTQAKRPREAVEAMQEAWEGVSKARRAMAAASAAMGKATPWAGLLARTHANLYRCALDLEQITGEIKTIEREQSPLTRGE